MTPITKLAARLGRFRHGRDADRACRRAGGFQPLSFIVKDMNNP